VSRVVGSESVLVRRVTPRAPILGINHQGITHQEVEIKMFSKTNIRLKYDVWGIHRREPCVARRLRYVIISVETTTSLLSTSIYACIHVNAFTRLVICSQGYTSRKDVLMKPRVSLQPNENVIRFIRYLPRSLMILEAS